MANPIAVTNKRLTAQFTDHTPIRRVVAPTGGIVRGKIPSYKMGCMVAYESLLEKDAILLFEFSPGVIGIREQPMKITYELAGKLRWYTPDFEISLANGNTVVIEVKPASKLTKPENAVRFRHLKRIMAEQGHDFLILTDDIIRRPLLLSNLKRLHPFCFQRLDEQILRRVKEAYQDSLVISFAELNAITKSLSQTYAFIAQGLVWCDLEQPLLPETVMKHSDKEANNVLFLF